MRRGGGCLGLGVLLMMAAAAAATEMLAMATNTASNVPGRMACGREVSGHIRLSRCSSPSLRCWSPAQAGSGGSRCRRGCRGGELAPYPWMSGLGEQAGSQDQVDHDAGGHIPRAGLGGLGRGQGRVDHLEGQVLGEFAEAPGAYRPPATVRCG